MINTAADYDFVTGENVDSLHPHGDLDRITINGDILPLRAGGREKLVRGEDIAFLAECARERAGAFKGLYYNGFGYEPYNTAPAKCTFANRAAPAQLLSARSFLGVQLQRGIPSFGGGNGYLASALQEEANIYTASGSGIARLLSSTMSYLSTTYGGHWTSSTTAEDFAAGVPLAHAAVASLFGDTRLLSVPIFRTAGFVGQFTSGDYMSVTAIKGGPNVPAGASFGYFVYSYNEVGSEYNAVYRGDFKVSVAFTLPKKYLLNAEAWLVYSADNGIIPVGGSAWSRNDYSGILRLEPYLNRLDTDDEFVWAPDPVKGLALLNRIKSDCGVTFYNEGEVYHQQFEPLFENAIIFVGTPNARTKWWT